MTQLIFIDAKWDGEIKLTEKVLAYLKKQKIKSLAVFSSVQFTELNILKEQLKNAGIEVRQTKAKRTSNAGQILGCDLYHNSFQQDIIDDCDAIMYVGDGLFHPKALLLAQIKKQNIKPVIIYDPMAKDIQILTEKSIEAQVKKTKRNLRMFINANTIGILVTTKPGQQYLGTAKRLKAFLEKQGKKAYIFIDDVVNINALENYPFIQCWVNTACPRIGSDDIVNTDKPIINLREAGNP